jgi:hypothetical protein
LTAILKAMGGSSKKSALPARVTRSFYYDPKKVLQKLTGPTQLLLAVLDGVVAQPDNSSPAATATTAKRADRLIAVRKVIDIVVARNQGVALGAQRV